MCAAHPRHRLGVCALALDTATPLVGRPAPAGILYIGARDGLVLAWDLALPTRPRARRYAPPSVLGRWEMMTGWADDVLDDEDEDEEGRSDGDVPGEVTAGRRRGRRRRRDEEEEEIPWEERGETDMEAFQPGQVGGRQGAEAGEDRLALLVGVRCGSGATDSADRPSSRRPPPLGTVTVTDTIATVLSPARSVTV